MLLQELARKGRCSGSRDWLKWGGTNTLKKYICSGLCHIELFDVNLIMYFVSWLLVCIVLKRNFLFQDYRIVFPCYLLITVLFFIFKSLIHLDFVLLSDVYGIDLILFVVFQMVTQLSQHLLLKTYLFPTRWKTSFILH